MNRQEAAREIDNTACCFSDKRFRDAMHMAADALRGPQPDPITGLVPCGCGGKAEIGQYCEVTCDKCGASVPANYTEADAKAAWNTARGWKGGAEWHLTILLKRLTCVGWRATKSRGRANDTKKCADEGRKLYRE